MQPMRTPSKTELGLAEDAAPSRRFGAIAQAASIAVLPRNARRLVNPLVIVFVFIAVMAMN
jgi:hypothetical protein